MTTVNTINYLYRTYFRWTTGHFKIGNQRNLSSKIEVRQTLYLLFFPLQSRFGTNICAPHMLRQASKMISSDTFPRIEAICGSGRIGKSDNVRRSSVGTISPSAKFPSCSANRKHDASLAPLSQFPAARHPQRPSFPVTLTWKLSALCKINAPSHKISLSR